jgi:hypothetical protein
MPSRERAVWTPDRAQAGDAKFNPVPSGREGCSAVLTHDSRFVIVAFGYDGEWRDDVWYLDLASMSWQEANLQEPAGSVSFKRSRRPVARSGHSATMVDNAGRAHMVVFGGFNGSDKVAGVLRDVAVLDLHEQRKPRWFFPVISGTQPPGRESHCAHLLPDAEHSLLVVGGYASGGQKSDAWLLSTLSWAWSELRAAGPAAELQVARSKFASFMHGGELFVFGGDAGSGKMGDGAGSSRDDVVALRVLEADGRTLCAQAAWRAVPVSGPAPAARNGHTLTLSNKPDMWLLFGGTDGGLTRHADLHVLALAAGQWAWRAVPCEVGEGRATAPVGREWHSALWSPSLDELVVLFGSLGTKYTNEVASVKLALEGQERSSACGLL